MTNRTASFRPGTPGLDPDHDGPRLGTPYLPAQLVVHGTAFAVLCLWLRTTPGALRRRLASEADCEGALLA